jgi:hypothetical protein
MGLCMNTPHPDTKGGALPGDMSARIEDGGSAFPVPGWPDDASFNGMTLRDYFAAKALPVVQAGCQMSRADFLHPDQFEMAAIDAYKLADAMLKARTA